MTRSTIVDTLQKYVPIFFFGSIVIAAIMLVAAPWTPTWGERHLFDEAKGTVRLGHQKPITQSFIWEYPRLAGVALWISTKNKPTEGGVVLTVRNTKTHTEQKIQQNLNTVSPQGVIFFSLPEALSARSGTRGEFSIELIGTTAPVFLQYQIDGSIFPDGELQHRHGDLGFQLTYTKPALGTITRNVAYAVALCIAGCITAIILRRVLRQQPRYTKQFGVETLIALTLGAAVCIFYLVFLGRNGTWIGPGDFTKDVAYLQSGIEHIKNGSWPVWSHLTCGGLPLLGNPESNILSVGSLFGLFVPPEQALRILLTFEAALGAIGVYICGRLLTISRYGSIVAAIIALLSSPYAYKIVEGFSMIGGAVAFTPWVFVGLILATEYKRAWGMLLGGTALGLMFLRGDVHIIVGVVIMLCVIAGWLAIVRKSRLPLYACLGIAAVSFLWATPKLLAYLEDSSIFTSKLKPYVVRLWDQGLLDDVFLKPLDRKTKVPVLYGTEEHWGNFGSYTGLLPWIFAMVGLLARKPYRGLMLLGAIVTFIIGEGAFYDLVLRHLGEIGTLLRVPTRIFIIFVIFLGLLAGRGLDTITRYLPTYVRLIASLIVITAMTYTLASVTGKILNDNFTINTTQITRDQAQPLLREHSNTDRSRHPSVLLARGHVLPYLCADLNTGQEFVEKSLAANSIASVPASLTPNTITLFPDETTRNIDVYVNATPLWVSSVPILPNTDGSLHLLVPSKTSELTITYVSSLTRVEQLILIVLGITSSIVIAYVFLSLTKFSVDQHQPDQ